MKKKKKKKKKIGWGRGKNKVNLPTTLGQKRESHQCAIHPSIHPVGGGSLRPE
jgi:hypothetical protein